MAKINRQEIYDMFNQACGYCGKDILTIKDMQVDHIEPQWRFKEGFVKGDMNDPSNLMPTCRTCNHYKSGHNLDGFRNLMTTLHERVSSIYIVKVALKHGIVQIKPFDGKFYFEKFKEGDNGK
jgi:5-methylcytosine-specific restriction endonuclease McrA